MALLLAFLTLSISDSFKLIYSPISMPFVPLLRGFSLRLRLSVANENEWKSPNHIHRDRVSGRWLSQQHVSVRRQLTHRKHIFNISRSGALHLKFYLYKIYLHQHVMPLLESKTLPRKPAGQVDL